jgi:DNA-binding SARP family transcriptional activator
MGRLSVALLGTPQIRHDGRHVVFPTRKSEALLIFLAVEGGFHSRERLTALLWPESDEEHARGSLRSALAFLRQVLAETQEQHGPPHLLVERALLTLAEGAELELDIHTLREAAELSRGAARVPVHELVARLREATSRYRGDFLEGFSLSDAPDFDDWVSQQRERWHRQAGLVFDRLSQALFDGGELLEAIDVASRWVALDPLNEAAHHCLIRAQAAAGDWAAARRSYRACRAILAEELGAEPGPEIEALSGQIRRRAVVRSAPAAGEADADLAPPHLPLVGRLTEHTRLVAAYQSACRGTVQVVSVEGEPGIGKTRLLESFLRWASAQGAEILEGRAFETGGRLPYQPVVEALRPALNRWLDQGSPPLAPVWLAELSRLFPELLDRYPDLPIPAAKDQIEARPRLFEAVARFGQSLAEPAHGRGTVLFIDDLQWADAGSLDLLHYLARRWAAGGAPILVLLALRSDELAPPVPRLGMPGLGEWLAALARDVPLARLSLGPLTIDDTVRLVASLVRLEPDQRADDRLRSFGEQLFADTGGQPFFLIETLKALRERQVAAPQTSAASGVSDALEALAQDYAAWREREGIPPGIRQLVRARLARLSPPGLLACQAAAVLGDGFDVARLCQVTRLDEMSGLRTLDELLERGLIREASLGDEPTVRFDFTHDRIREVAYDDAGESRRQVLHRRALEAFAAAGAPAARLAEHAVRAGLAERAFHLSLTAGDEAMRLFAVRDALGHYEQARRLAEELLEREAYVLPPQALMHLYEQVGRAYELVMERRRALECYEEMLVAARARGLPAMECAALNRQATLLVQDLRDLARADALLRAALAVAERSGNRSGLAETEWNLAMLDFYTWDPEGAVAHGGRALALARELGEPELTARILDVLAYSQYQLGRWSEAEAAAGEGRRLFAEFGNRVLEAGCLVLLARVDLARGRPQGGLETARAAYAMSRSTEHSWAQANSAKEVAATLLETGEYGPALETARDAVALARDAGFIPLLVAALVVLGRACRTLVLLEEARTTQLEAARLNDDLKSPLYAEAIATELCAVEATAGRWAAAHDCARQALAARTYRAAYPGLTRWYETEALARAGELELARADLLSFAGQPGFSPRARLQYLRGLAALAAHTGDLDEARRNLREARRLARRIRLPGELWEICATLGALDRAAGDERAARRSLAQVTEILQALAPSIEDEALRAALLSATPAHQGLVYQPLA